MGSVVKSRSHPMALTEYHGARQNLVQLGLNGDKLIFCPAALVKRARATRRMCGCRAPLNACTIYRARASPHCCGASSTRVRHTRHVLWLCRARHTLVVVGAGRCRSGSHTQQRRRLAHPWAVWCGSSSTATVASQWLGRGRRGTGQGLTRRKAPPWKAPLRWWP